VVVDGDDVFVRSVRGDRGHWFQSAVESPDSIVLRAGNRSLPVRAILATDAASIERCSAALRRKYAGNQAVRSMLRPEVLDTTLQLEPRLLQPR
jgi:hypothetical protein